jgi:hypothetical protein
MPDSLGWRMKFGVIAPSTNTVVQPEFDEMRPVGVTSHFGRIHIPNDPLRGDDDFTRLIETVRREIMSAIDRVMTCEPGHLVMGLLPTPNLSTGYSHWGCIRGGVWVGQLMHDEASWVMEDDERELLKRIEQRVTWIAHTVIGAISFGVYVYINYGPEFRDTGSLSDDGRFWIAVGAAVVVGSILEAGFNRN